MRIRKAGPEAKKLLPREKKRFRKKLRKRERQVETAFQDIAFNRKTINHAFGEDQSLLGSRAKNFSMRGRKIYDFLGHQRSQADARDRAEYQERVRRPTRLFVKNTTSASRSLRSWFRAKKTI